MRRQLLIAFVMLLSVGTWVERARAQDNSLKLIANATEVEIGQVFQIRIEASGDDIDADSIDVPNLGAFDVVGRSTQRSFSFQFGSGGGSQLGPQLTYVLHLRAVKEGKFSLGPARAQAGKRVVQSEPVEISVTKATGNATAPASQASPNDPFAQFMDPFADFDQDQADQRVRGDTIFVRMYSNISEAYVGQQVLVSTRLYSRSMIDANSVAVKPPKFDGFWMQRLESADRVGRQEINGRVYFVYELTRDAVFPLRAGTLKIGAAEVDLLLTNYGFFSRPQHLKRQSQELTINVKPLPEPVPKSLTVGTPQVNLSIDRTAMRTGEAATVEARVNAEGNLKNFNVELEVPPGLKVLSPNVQERMNTALDRFSSEQKTTWLVIAEKAGSYEIRVRPLQTFDLAKASYQSVEVAPVHIEVVQGDAATTVPSASTSSGPSMQESQPSMLIPLRMHTQWKSAPGELAERPWFWWLVLSLWATLFFTWLATKLKKRLMPTAGLREIAFEQLNEGERAAKRGETTTALQKTQDALDSALSEVIGSAARGLPLSEVQKALQIQRLASSIREELAALHSELNTWRFAATTVSTEQISTLIARTRRLLAQLSDAEMEKAA